MPSKNFLLLSLEDDKIKKVSNVISNDSCRKILDCLSIKEATESEIAEKLQIPISTLHYNLQQLIETELISAEEFHYSEKGKEVMHYKLANKYIIIAPKKTFGIKEKLKHILPVVLVIGAATIILQYIQKFIVSGGVTRISESTKQTLVKEVFVTQKIPESAAFAKEAAAAVGIEAAKSANVGAANFTPSVAQEVINKTSEYMLKPEVSISTATIPPSIWSNIALWFLAGALFSFLFFFILILF